MRVFAWYWSVCAAALTATACAAHRATPTPFSDEMRGLFETGYEAYDFRPCDSTAVWPRGVRFAAGVEPPSTARGGRGSYNSVVYFVRWRGTVTAPDPATFRRAVIVREVIEIRQPLRGECGWRPGHGVSG